MHANEILVVAGSVRPLRRSPTIAAWVASLGAEVSGDSFRLVEVADLALGLDDEPGIPAMGAYVRDTTRRWSEQVAAAKAVVLVTPQYNWGYPAALKNAIDHLYREWKRKPVLIVSYGSRGGEKCAAQLRQVLGGMDVRLTEATPELKLSRERIEADDGAIEPEVDFADQRTDVVEALRELVALASQDA